MSEEDIRGKLPTIDEIVPSKGLVYSEESFFQEILSKPKILPLKSMTLEKIEEMEKIASEKGNEQVNQ